MEMGHVYGCVVLAGHSYSGGQNRGSFGPGDAASAECSAGHEGLRYSREMLNHPNLYVSPTQKFLFQAFHARL